MPRLTTKGTFHIVDVRNDPRLSRSFRNADSARRYLKSLGA